MEGVLASDLKPHHRRQRKTTAVLAVLLVAAGGYFGWFWLHSSKGTIAAASETTGGKQSAAIPVVADEVRRADFPVFLEGLGTVQPFDTVTVRSRVDGEVIKIAFKQGEMVKEGDLLVQIDPRPYQAALDQAVAKKAQDDATLKNAQLDLQRYASLAKDSFGSRQQSDTQKALVDQLTAQIQGDQAAIDNARTQLGYATIKSPLTGKAGFRLVDPGNIVHATDAGGIVTIAKLQPISVVFTAPEGDLPRISKALEAGTATVEALTSNGQKSLGQGRLALLNNQVDQTNGTISMKATFANADGALWPGLSVSTRLLVDTLKQVTVVPDTAVERGPNGPYAFVVGDGNKVEVRALGVGEQGGGQSVVTTGLAPGEKVVTAGQYRLTQGAPVQATLAAAQNEMVQNQSGEAK
jgi:membrane fusion protein, multidrug efflux system